MEASGFKASADYQLAIERSIPEAFKEAFNEGQRQRGFRLVTDLPSEGAEEAREESPVLAETQPEPESQAQRHLDEESDEEVLELIEKVKQADPDSEEFWEGKIALFFGRDLSGRKLPESENVQVHADEREPVEQKTRKPGERRTEFWTEHP